MPFLFAFRVDRVPVHRDLDCWAKCGGINSFREVVPAGTARTWSVQVSRASIAELLGSTRPSTIEVVAAFSERQHQAWFAADARIPEFDATPPFRGPQVLVRSNVVRVAWRRATKIR